MAAYYFPRDILTDIFLRLPVETLAFDACVCKLWREIITDPLFIAKHSNRSHCHQGKKQFLFLERYYPRCPLIPIEREFPHDSTFKAEDNILSRFVLPQRKPDGDTFYHYTLCSCKGLVLTTLDECSGIQKIKNVSFFIANPLLHIFFPLPSLESYLRPWIDDIGAYGYAYSGIGYDSVSKDYKVLILVTFYESNIPRDILLYSLNTNTWKDISAKARYLNIRSLPSQRNSVFMNGYLHWIACTGDDDRSLKVILRFDMTREQFDIMRFPRIDGKACYFSLAIVFGKICVGYSRDYVVSIWLMNEYGVKASWTKQFHVKCVRLTMVLGSNRDGDIILFNFPKRIVSYNPKSKEVKFIGDPRRRLGGISLYMDNSEESLVLFDRGVPIRSLEPPYPKKQKTN